jgi:CO dehydrogenase/acetyl-CoA synthase gamma subunit (corrinoid Fe-S protein)
MADEIFFTSEDAGRQVAFDLLLDAVEQDLTSATIECHMRRLDDGGVTVVVDVTADVDQVTYPGRCVTEFTAADLTAGVYTLEWESTIAGKIITYPGKASDRPVLTVREQAA